MRILFVRGNFKHINDMHINNVLSLMNVAEVTFWGPGYVSRESLEAGIKHFWIEKGGFDAIILDFNIAMLHTSILDIRLAYHWNRYFIGDTSIFDMVRYADNIIKDVSEIDATKILYYYFDTDSFKEKWLDIFIFLEKAGFYFWINGLEFFPEFDENSFENKIWNLTNRYRYFALKYKNRIISMPYATTNYSEYCATLLEDREFDITIPGNLDRIPYPERYEIYQIVKKLDYRQYSDYGNRSLGYRADRERVQNSDYLNIDDKIIDERLEKNCVYIKSKTNEAILSAWKSQFVNGLNRSKMGYTDGSSSFQIVRKHAEIPAHGALLLCQSIPPLEPYGFVEWESMVTVSKDNIEERCEYLLKHINEMQEIARRGQGLVMRTHSGTHQSRLLLQAIRYINNGEFIGSEWIKGDFIITTRSNNNINVSEMIGVDQL